MLNCIYKGKLQDAYPKISFSYQIYFTILVTFASCERSFGKLKLIKSYVQSTSDQASFNNLSILFIDNCKKDKDMKKLLKITLQKNVKKLIFKIPNFWTLKCYLLN